MLVNLLVYFSTLQVEAAYFSETSVDVQWAMVISHTIKLFQYNRSLQMSSLYIFVNFNTFYGILKLPKISNKNLSHKAIDFQNYNYFYYTAINV
jgi:hypothetical protein